MTGHRRLKLKIRRMNSLSGLSGRASGCCHKSTCSPVSFQQAVSEADASNDQQSNNTTNLEN